MTIFSLTEDSKGKSLAIFYGDGDTDCISETHPSFQNIIDLWFSGDATDDSVHELADILKTVAKRMMSLSERVSVLGKKLLFDGDELRGELADVLLELVSNGLEADYSPLVNFLEKAQTNPSLKSLDDLYRWIANGDLALDPDGDIVAYKTVMLLNGEPVSVSAEGSAFVDGVEITGHIPNPVGAVITMPRSEVDANEFEHCSYGLHAGTHAYATEFATWQARQGIETVMILVKFNPRDVVTVPTDFTSSKLRVSRYVVMNVIGDRMESKIFTPRAEDTRDEKGRFTKESAVKAKRDSKGRFIKA